MPAPDSNSETVAIPWLRAAVGGALMGLANLVPGISGGTMLLAAGIYAAFIDAVAQLSRLRFQRHDLLLILTVTAAAALAIAGLAGAVKDLVIGYRWIMYSLFVGLTLGGVPTLWRAARPADLRVWLGIAVGLSAMLGLGLLPAGNAGADDSNIVALFVAGLAGAASMILPGISGGYLLLVLGQYVPILASIDRAVDSLATGQFAGVRTEILGVFLPVAVGMLVGVAVVSNAVRYCLRVHRKATLGVLLGLLAGVVVGLWPFQRCIEPRVGDVIKGRVVTEATVSQIAPEDCPVGRFAPTARQAAMGLSLVALGATATLLLAHFSSSSAATTDGRHTSTTN